MLLLTGGLRRNLPRPPQHPKWVHFGVTRYSTIDVMSYDGQTMSTQLSISKTDDGWAILNGTTPIAISGEVYRATKEELVEEVQAKGLFVWSDSSIQKTQEEGLSVKGKAVRAAKLDAEASVSENDAGGAPPTQDPPTDPGADPEDPDPNPTVPVKPKRVRKPRAVKPKDEEPPMVFTDEEPPADVTTIKDLPLPKPVDDYSDLLNEADFDAALVKPVDIPPAEPAHVQTEAEPEKPKRTRVVKPKITVDKEKLAQASKDAKTALSKAKKVVKPADEKKVVERKPRAKKPADAPRFTDEQKKARAEYARKYRQSMTEEQKEAAKARAAERQKRWRENHPDAVSKYAKRSSERRKERYNTDPEYRQDYRAKQRAYASAGKTEVES